MTDKLIETAIENIDIGSVVVKSVDEITTQVYEDSKYYIRVLLITCVVIALLCLAFSCTTLWANYVVITNNRVADDIFAKLEEAERRDRPLHDYTYRSKYNYDSLGEVERLVYDQYQEALEYGIDSIALEDMRIENVNNPFDAYQSRSPDSPSPLMITLVQDSWLSASNSQYILDKSNGNRIIAEFFVDSKDVDSLSAFLSSKSYSDTYELSVPNSELILIIKFHLYEKDKKNKVFHRVSESTDNFVDYIPIKHVTPLHSIDVYGLGEVRTFARFAPLKAEQKKPYLFYYWQNDGNNKTPAHIKLSLKTIEKHGSKSFNLVKLDESNIFDYLPELKPHQKRLEEFNISHRVDIYRIYLLYKYGGLYVDADTVVLKDLKDLIKPLKTSTQDDMQLRIEYIGFGCTGKTCKNDGYMKPSNGLMASRKGAFLMHDIRQNLQNLIFTKSSRLTASDLQKTDKTYFTIGKHLIWFTLGNLQKTHRYTYYHIDSNLIGIRDKDGLWVRNSRLFGMDKIEYKDEKAMYLVVFYNSDFKDQKLMREVKESDLINSKMQISRFFKRALK